MFFDFEDRHFETPGLESAMSWREQVLLSLFLHLAVLALAIFIPQLDFVRAAQERRAASSRSPSNKVSPRPTRRDTFSTAIE